jgi:hypothetical protein
MDKSKRMAGLAPIAFSKVKIAQTEKKKMLKRVSGSSGELMMDKSDKIFVAGHRGLVGNALIRRLEHEAFTTCQ